jgi:predicted HicB family RNase H-like nuclease
MLKNTKYINIGLSEVLHSRLKAIASLERKTIKQYAIEAITEKINHEGQL